MDADQQCEGLLEYTPDSSGLLEDTKKGFYYMTDLILWVFKKKKTI